MMMKRSGSEQFQAGFDYSMICGGGIKVPLHIPIGHLICVGGSGSGKSTALLYWMYKIRRAGIDVTWSIMDFKASKEFEGITMQYAEYERCYEQICRFYEMFTGLKEGGDGTVRILLIDEVAGMLSHYSMSKDGKARADKIRQIMSSILMMGRSRKCYLWLAMQRYTASIFPASSGAADNFYVCVGLARLSVDSRRSLFAGEHLKNEERMLFGQGTGLILVDGRPLEAIVIPRVDKVKIIWKLRGY